jgi:hypothetical protein
MAWPVSANPSGVKTPWLFPHCRATKQAAENLFRGARSVRARLYRLRKNSSGEQEVSGHDFSRADKVGKMRRALAPANPYLAEFAFRLDFFRSL